MNQGQIESSAWGVAALIQAIERDIVSIPREVVG